MGKQVVLKFSAGSNISYLLEYETGYSPEEWAGLPDRVRADIAEEALWGDIDYWEEEEDE